MTNNINPLDLQGFGFYANRLAGIQAFNENEQKFLQTIFGRLAEMQGVPRLPEAPSGDKRGSNTLRRTNWFNGRYLTAEALSRQDVYFDHRSRLNAQALMPGIAWGLGIKGENPNEELILQPGLAIDGIGRPILVSQAFSFNLKDLTGESQKTPRVVVGGQREFMPCVCLAPDPGGTSGGGPGMPSGSYLLVIEAGEMPTGKAKVTGDLCGGRASGRCEADAWQGSFGLSLVRFPVDVPLSNDKPNLWELRGTLSAYYFDVFEHRLWKRWDPAFPIDGSFETDSDLKRHEGMAVPLALLHLDTNNSALFLDQWIPRRMICATPGEDWHRICFGAPPRAAAWARIHQFQTMLDQSLVEYPISPDSSPGNPQNLYSRGFRHIPPIGFLPLKPKKTGGGQGGGMPDICTDFSKITTNEIANGYQGNYAYFRVMNDSPTCTILGAQQARGLYLDEAKCEITLPVSSQQVSLSIIIASNGLMPFFPRALSANTSTTRVVKAYDSQSRELDSRSLTGSESTQTIHFNNNGIRYVTIEAGPRTMLISFCFQPEAVIGETISETATRLAMVQEASRQATAYFSGSNVVLYSVVALHDDDILEDLRNVIDKDPIQLKKPDNGDKPYSNWPRKNASISDQLAALTTLFIINPASRTGFGVLAFLGSLLYLLRSRGLYIEPLVNRHTEVVKLMVPLQGLSRLHPVIGTTPKDAVSQAQEWELVDTGNRNAATLAGLLEEGGVDVLPRSFVVYVKQRIVLLDLVFMALEILQLILDLVLTSVQASSGSISHGSIAPDQRTGARLMTTATTQDYRSAFRTQSESDQLLIRSTLAQPLGKELLVRTMAATTPALAKPGRAQLLVQEVQSVSQQLPPSMSDQERQAIALGEVADAWAAEFPDAQVLQLLSAVQPPQQTLDLMQQLEARPGPTTGTTVADSLDLKPPSRFATNTSRVLYAEARQRLQERPLKELISDSPATGLVASLTVGELLARSPQEAARILEGTDKLDVVNAAFLKERKEALDAAAELADGAPAELVAQVENAVAVGEQPAAALSRLKVEEEAKPQPNAQLLRKISSAETLLRVSGNRIETLGALRRHQGG